MCVESLEPGQVWELYFATKLVPALLLQLHGVDSIRPRFEVLDLTTGRVEVADVARWSDPHLGKLVGERLL